MKKSPENFKLEKTSIWSFQQRGNWLTHNGKYRGNCSPYIPRNVILKYSNLNDIVLDPFVGSGTTLIEAQSLGRTSIGIDINPHALEITKRNLDFKSRTKNKVYLKLASAEKMNFIPNHSIDLIFSHPPYSDIINYSYNNKDDFSLLPPSIFLKKMKNVSLEFTRILKKDKYCTLLISDLRKNGKFYPLGFQTMQIFLKSGFELTDIAIKEQHNCTSTKKWAKRDNKFLLIAHEYLFIFRL